MWLCRRPLAKQTGAGGSRKYKRVAGGDSWGVAVGTHSSCNCTSLCCRFSFCVVGPTLLEDKASSRMGDGGQGCVGWW